MKRVVTLKELVALREDLKKAHKTVVFTNGVFDILHAGHLSLLEKARAFGDVLIVGVNTDSSARRLKGESRPIVPFRDRTRLLAALRVVDYVVGFSADTPEKLISKLCPDVLVKGSDYKVAEIAGASKVIANGGRVERVKLLSDRSTSRIVKLIREFD
jgi:rfaE bifunctional protein nucleotidyltransferase chain/domain